MDYNKDDHLEDFDSKKGDIEKGSLAATQSSESSRQHSEIEEGIQRGMLNARQDEQNNTTARSPDRFMQMLQNGGGYSVTTGQMNDLGGDDGLDDTYTFDGSTITSANDITHKKFQRQQQQVVQFPNQDTNGNNQYPPIKPNPSRGTESTYSSDKGSRRSEYSTDSFCCGLGRLAVILLSVALTSVAVAIILWLTLGYLPSQGGSSPSSACCKGTFEPAWSGREICNANDICCVVCASTISEDGNNVVLGVTGPENEEPRSETPEPTPLPTTTEPMVTPALTDDPEETTTPAPSPEVTKKCCEDAWEVWGDYLGRERCSADDPKNCCSVCDSNPTAAPSVAVSQSRTASPSQTASSIPSASPTQTTSPSPTTSPKDFFGNGNGNGDNNSGNENGNSNGNEPTSAPTSKCCDNPWQVWGDYLGRERCTVENGVNVCCTVC